jgi:hypothetical protein
MKNYNFLSIQGMPLLVKHLQNVWESYGRPAYTNRTKDSQHDLVNLDAKNIRDYLSIYLIEKAVAPIENCKFFICKPGEWGEVHIDGGDPARNCAINIPIFNCNSGYMNWFCNTPDDDRLISNDQTNVHSTKEKANIDFWNLEEQFILTKPALVRTNSWHNVDNRLNSKFRIVFSMRLQGNPEFSYVASRLNQLSS